MSQINLRLPTNLRKIAEKYAKTHGFKNLQELAAQALREKIFERESLKETLEIMKNKKLMESIRRSREDVKKGRVISWRELQRRWKRAHGKI